MILTEFGYANDSGNQIENNKFLFERVWEEIKNNSSRWAGASYWSDAGLPYQATSTDRIVRSSFKTAALAPWQPNPFEGCRPDSYFCSWAPHCGDNSIDWNVRYQQHGCDLWPIHYERNDVFFEQIFKTR